MRRVVAVCPTVSFHELSRCAHHAQQATQRPQGTDSWDELGSLDSLDQLDSQGVGYYAPPPGNYNGGYWYDNGQYDNTAGWGGYGQQRGGYGSRVGYGRQNMLYSSWDDGDFLPDPPPKAPRVAPATPPLVNGKPLLINTAIKCVPLPLLLVA
jgi:hypothetical protein